MILNHSELQLLLPQIDLMASSNNPVYIETKLVMPGGRVVEIKAGGFGVNIMATFPEDTPVIEHYQSLQGLAQAYGFKPLMVKANLL